MGLPERYAPAEFEPHWQAFWAQQQTYAFVPDSSASIYAIDTPPPTVSGELHIGHVYSYVQAEAIARFQRMQGKTVYYPFGFDDNGLPTERFVERNRKIRARTVGREAFIATCLEVSQQVEDRFEAFWKRLGMSVDWHLRYSTIDPNARRIAQWSFLDLYQRGRIYRSQAPNPWCVECQTAIAQAELDDAERTTTFSTIRFGLPESADQAAWIATTRPELLPACVALFVHPDDQRYQQLIGHQACVPLTERLVPILADSSVDPHKGTGIVMCCTFGDAIDLLWWQKYQLPLIALLGRDGRLTEAAGAYAGLGLAAARTQILADLAAQGLLGETRSANQTVRIHERCKTPIEILETSQWFIRVLDLKQELLEAGRKITWRPEYMRTRYEHWVQNLNWDWCISRQRFFGVPFPAWHCQACGAVVLADPAQLPIDPLSDPPPGPCGCGNQNLLPDSDVMDTWATSSLSPLIATRFTDTHQLNRPAPALLPMQLRPQAHDIIRTWAFSTIVKHHLHFGQIPWETIMISGHALAPDGSSIHKSLGNSPIAPEALIERYGADPVRYWACGGALGSDQPVNEEAMRQGKRLCTKLWSAARLLSQWDVHHEPADIADLPYTPCDRALRSWTQHVLAQATRAYQQNEYATARDLAERFFWDIVCDQALEWAKGRLYDGTPPERQAALLPLAQALRTTLFLLAPILPHITETIYQGLFADPHTNQSLHQLHWPAYHHELVDPHAEQVGTAVIAIGAAVRRYKSQARLALSTQLEQLSLVVHDQSLAASIHESLPDLQSLTRASTVAFVGSLEGAETVMPGIQWLIN